MRAKRCRAALCGLQLRPLANSWPPQALHAPPCKLVAGEAHPLLHLGAGYRVHHSDLAAALRVPRGDDVAVFDSDTQELVFAAPSDVSQDFVLQLPITVALPGGDIFTL